MQRTLTLLTVSALLATGCTKSDITGRRKFNAMPNGVMNNMGQQGYQQMLSEHDVQAGGPKVKTLRRVGQRIAAAADEPKFAWEFNLFKEPTINAWCMPGGYIGFYDGILPILQSEAGMAFVMGHEVAHATHKHSGERMTQTLGLQGALSVANAFISGSSMSDGNKNTAMGALGLGAEVGVILPFSRKHETESDIVGLMYMADAGYPPGQATGVWQRMDAAGGERPPEFLSTHPAPDTRIAEINEWLPQARKRYRRNIRTGEKLTETIFQADGTYAAP